MVVRARRVSMLLASVVLSVVTVSPAGAAPITLTFDSGDPIGGLPTGSVLSTQYAAVGVIFSPNGLPSLVSGHVLRSVGGWTVENGDASVRVEFGIPVSEVSATFAGILEPPSTQLLAFDGDTLVDRAIATGAAQQVLTVASSTPITSVVLLPGSFFDFVTIDNLVFAPLAEIPEPSAVLLLGLAVAWVAARRRT